MEEKTELKVVEEHFEDVATGVEAEAVDGSENGDAEKEPWDPDRIRIHTKAFSIRNVVDQIKDGDLDLAPDFQRYFVWKSKQKSNLIESILLGIPLPSFYFNELADGRYQVVDGVQRLTTIYQYVKQQLFTLGKVDYLGDLEGKSFNELDASFRRRVFNTQIYVHVIDPQTPVKLKFDIFRRINTGGSALSTQEIRHCISRNRSRKFLRELVDTDEFQTATAGSLKNHVRMADKEVALRVCAFLLHSPADYSEFESLDEFLVSVTNDIDNVDELDDAALESLRADFVRGMENSFLIFGDHAFRKWPNWQGGRNPINRALVETWGTLLADYDADQLVQSKDAIVERARTMMSDDGVFIDAISASTGAHSKVMTRFGKVSELLKEVMG